MSDWKAVRIYNVTLEPMFDDMVEVVVSAHTLNKTCCRSITTSFAVSAERPSRRFNSLLHASGIVDRIDDVRELEGRYFSIRKNGADVNDFAPLENAFSMALMAA